MSVKCFRLVSGEDIIATILDDAGDTLRIKNPIQIALIPNENGVGITLIPFLPFAESKEFIVEGLSILPYDPSTDLYNHYNSAFGTGIILPETPNPPKLTLLK